MAPSKARASAFFDVRVEEESAAATLAHPGLRRHHEGGRDATTPTGSPSIRLRVWREDLEGGATPATSLLLLEQVVNVLRAEGVGEVRVGAQVAVDRGDGRGDVYA